MMQPRLLKVVLLIISVCGHQPARAEGRETGDVEHERQLACARAYERVQELRLAGQLVAARNELRTCMAIECRDFIRSDCGQWFEELDTAIPSVVFAVQRNGQDVDAVRVEKNGRPFLDRVGVQAYELDPGEYEFRFTAAGCKPATMRVVVREGERHRILSVNLIELAPKRALSSPTPSPVQARRSYIVPAILGGVGAAGVAGFATLGLMGYARETQLKHDCAPQCTNQAVAETEKLYTAADASLAVGVVALAAAGYFLYDPGMGQRRAASLWQWTVGGLPSGGWAAAIRRSY